MRGDSAKFKAGLAHGFARADPLLAGEVGGAGLEVEGQFVVHIGFKAGPTGDGAEPGFCFRPDRAHDGTSAVSLRMAPMMPAIWFQRSVSAVSCFRPAGVRV